MNKNRIFWGIVLLSLAALLIGQAPQQCGSPSLWVVDGDDVPVGLFEQRHPAGYAFFYEPLGVVVTGETFTGVVSGSESTLTILFESDDCTGTPYTNDIVTGTLIHHPASGNVYRTMSILPEPIETNSNLNTGDRCDVQVRNIGIAVLEEVTESIPTFTPPLRIEVM